jgi:hypothetical protein
MIAESYPQKDLIDLAKLVQEMRRCQSSFFAGNKEDLAKAKAHEKMVDRRIAEILDQQRRLF